MAKNTAQLDKALLPYQSRNSKQTLDEKNALLAIVLAGEALSSVVAPEYKHS